MRPPVVNLCLTDIDNAMMKTSTYPLGFVRELPVGARQWRLGYGIPFGAALLKNE